MTPTALVTGASRGLGLALTAALTRRGTRVVVDARDAARLAAAVGALPHRDLVTALPGDITDPAHRAALARAAGDRLDLLVLNASALGPAPLPRLADLPPAAFEEVLRVNAVAPLALVQAALPALEPACGTVVSVSSDAAVEAYEGWGGYGAGKAALDLLTAVLAVEHPGLRVLAVDPGDMATDMHAAADPGADPADLADPADVAAALLDLLDGDVAGPRVRLADLTPAARP
ncbi:SDR family NAD(P)-dependent oxidoreductase [Geodermatophilus nigrescens]|uniref:Short-chain dehydrogenase n=1 Tax=Geodermatophilus nigrescens TaxID=1070870 RepID=A0A1M5DEP3_9ACTN|nr:SDR family NAD(P)-dependent oxidoreductase [Geodermatophilus nigrescens]SHF65395.1 Short-chain dehydrogenase [Geodermatophilus nigrescens]